MILLNPGPVNLSDRVRQSLLQPDLCHREQEFSQLQQKIREDLLKIYDLNPQQWASVLLTGSGTASVESMVSSLIPPDGKLLIVENGVYGERISQIARIHEIEHSSINHEWGEEIDFNFLETYLKDNRDLTHLAIIHHETTTGRRNSLEKISSICQKYHLSLLVDAVSSFGAEEICFEKWGITALAGTANKCLHGVPGTSFVIVNRNAFPKVEANPRTLYLDLETYCKKQDAGETPFTQSVQTFYALAEALAEFHDQGGWKARHQQYKLLMNRVRNGLKSMGIIPLLPDGESSVVLNSFYLPDGLSYQQLHDHLKAHGFIIYSGQGDLSKSIFRVSTMGAIQPSDMDRFLEVIRSILNP